MKWFFFIIGIIAIIVFFGRLAKKERRKKLMLKYGNQNLVERLMARQFLQGQTSGQLIDSIGRPADKGTQVLKLKTKETWKYQKTGNNRFALKIFLEDGIVVGWDKK